MSTPEPNGGDEEREGMSRGTIIGLVVFAVFFIAIGLCTWLVQGL